MTKHHFAAKVASMAFHAELSAGRKVGLDMHEAFISACKAQDDTFDLAMSADKPLVALGFRMVGGKHV